MKKGRKETRVDKVMSQQTEKILYPIPRMPKYIPPFADIPPFIAIPYFLAKIIIMNLKYRNYLRENEVKFKKINQADLLKSIGFVELDVEKFEECNYFSLQIHLDMRRGTGLNDRTRILIESHAR